MKKFMILISILFVMACESQEPNIGIDIEQSEVTVSDSDEFVCGRDMVKDADGNEYKTAFFDVEGGHDVTKEGQCWMVENLNVGTKILNPGEEPSDDDVIEKWCMTDDWTASYVSDCGKGGGMKEECNKLEKWEKQISSGEIESNINYCDGTNGLQRKGGVICLV